MTGGDLELSVHFGERDLIEGRFLADRIFDVFEANGLRTAILMRGVEGFGAKHRLRTDRLLTLSEDLPVLAVAIDEPERVRRAAAQIEPIATEGLITLAPRLPSASQVERSSGPHVKLAVQLGRGRRIAGRPAHEVVVERLREAGVEGASVLLGVDGLLGGVRRRAGFFSANADVPVIVVSVGSADAIARALPSIDASISAGAATLGRVDVCKRDGGGLTSPLSPADSSGSESLQKLTLYSSEQAHVDGRPVHVEAVRRLRAAGAVGATALRGVWGFDGRHPPHGDTFRTLRRRVPTMTVVIDAPARAQLWLELLDSITPERGVITSEFVSQASSSGLS